MQEIIPIIEAYLESRKSDSYEPIEFKRKLSRLGCSNDKVEDLLLKMDDEWTIEVLLELEEKKSIGYLRGSYFITITGLILTLVSTLDLIINENTIYIFYGAIIGGATGVVISKGSLRSIKHQRKTRKVKWTYWIEKNSSNVNRKFMENNLQKRSINEMFT
tara:strand:- start:2326 stop:2808 length:483 start_codon:yes stop_codon:yes gene_type:complete